MTSKWKSKSAKIREEINPHPTMETANHKKIQKHLQAIAKILYQEAETKELESLAGIEKTIRAQTKQLLWDYTRENRLWLTFLSGL